MSALVLAIDLGTGGAKGAVFTADGVCLAKSMVPYETVYANASWHEQRPKDWWRAVKASIAQLTSAPELVGAGPIAGIALSGHSLGVLPLDAAGEPLQELTPIWSDSRASQEAEEFFAKVDRADWYLRTGNGFPTPLYPLFKIMWLRRHAPDVFDRAHVFIGSKDYINLRMTGRIATDGSYASGTGAYDLSVRDYAADFLTAAGLEPGIFPDIVPSTQSLGTLLPDVADELGLPRDVQVFAGGVDNSCMALGARTFREGALFSSMGSSAWLTVSSERPLLDTTVRSYAFEHVVPGQVISATSIFSAGTTTKFLRDLLFCDADSMGRRGFDAMEAAAKSSPPGARGLIMVPTLGGGSSAEGGADVRGAILGLGLQHGRDDLARACYEGVGYALRVALDHLRAMTPLGSEILMVGGGAKSVFWRQVLADIFEADVVTTAVDEDAAALGAAALAFVGLGLWSDFSLIDRLHGCENRQPPEPSVRPAYDAGLAAYRAVAGDQAKHALALRCYRSTGSDSA